MRRWVAVLMVVVVLGGSQARADEASKRAKAQDLFTTLRMDRTMAQIMEMVMRQVKQQTQSMPGADQMTPEQKQRLDEFQKHVFQVTEEAVGWKALEPEYVDLYASTYSEEELDGILAFYKSPVGQAMLAKTPELATKSMQIAQRRMAEFQPKLQQMLRDYIKQSGAGQPKPASRSPEPGQPSPKT